MISCCTDQKCRFLHQKENILLGGEIFCGTGKGLDEKEKHSIALYRPAENVQNGRHFDLIVMLIFEQMTCHALCRLHFLNPKYVDKMPIWQNNVQAGQKTKCQENTDNLARIIHWRLGNAIYKEALYC